ncbi:hypothetical protein KIL84_018757 [Mauremys mutica]|uniref:Uncharacterized protein n=1 Tax=Mauremys mutica TaxID=74926 RepID=A0A9D3XVA3_9SAUR|nr:hypothetical protein KIL84_018757 [Mauremys mutica]
MSTAPALEDNRILQQLLRRVAQNLGIKAEEVVEESDPVVNILAPSGPSHIALPLIRMITETTKTLWQTSASLAPTAKRNERDMNMYTPTHPDSLVVDAANQQECQGCQGPTPKNREAKNLTFLAGRSIPLGDYSSAL